MQAGVCLRQEDTETTLPELTEQHRIRPKEEELSGLEFVHMAESETECAAPGLNTLEPECVTVHSGVSDVHHTNTSMIKTETDLGSTLIGDIKTENLYSTELGYLTHLHPGQIKTENDDEGYLKPEPIRDLQDIKCVNIKSDQMKCECSEILVSDLMSTVMNGAGVDHKDQTKPWQCAGEPNPNYEKEKSNDLLTQCGESSHHCDINNENNQSRIVQKGTNCRNEHVHCRRMNIIIEPMIIHSSKNTSLLNFVQNNTIHGNREKIYISENRYRCIQCGKFFSTNSALMKHLRVHTGEKPYKCTECQKCFGTKSDLKIHLRIHTGEKPYKCTQCERCFRTTSPLIKHLRIHTGEKPYKCSECPKCFCTKSNLKDHLRIHTGEKPYKCTQCERCFSTSSPLIKHLRIHTGEKPYKCSECPKRFSTTSNLKGHLRIHTGEKPCKSA
ncbi:hypothetical protein SKAU_G00118240 [Synaphobranchus kaupii]|uniref:C2H2-type domain-containing protein n=1 Tax=Synaphobranchus kaupii TaxID=118154 RepID=A0A9Q1FNT5_SYNKA|nr:hypothetical protein SKAU_G00118240 [Synaphobranchus kaupii]